MRSEKERWRERREAVRERLSLPRRKRNVAVGSDETMSQRNKGEKSEREIEREEKKKREKKRKRRERKRSFFSLKTVLHVRGKVTPPSAFEPLMRTAPRRVAPLEPFCVSQRTHTHTRIHTLSFPPSASKKRKSEKRRPNPPPRHSPSLGQSQR